MTDRMAPEGKLWVCFACGKTSHDRYGGFDATPGWDESCALNAHLVDEARVRRDSNGRVEEIVVLDQKEGTA